MIGTYEQCRNFIQDGDIIYFKRGFNLLNKIVEFVTNSPYYHCGICVWVENDLIGRKLMLLEASNGGRRLVSLSSYLNHEMDVIRANELWCIDNLEPIDKLFDGSGDVSYSYWKMVIIAIKELFNITISFNNKGEVCSSLVTEYLNYYGNLPLPKDISPGEQMKIFNTYGKFPEIQIKIKK